MIYSMEPIKLSRVEQLAMAHLVEKINTLKIALQRTQDDFLEVSDIITLPHWPKGTRFVLSKDLSSLIPVEDNKTKE